MNNTPSPAKIEFLDQRSYGTPAIIVGVALFSVLILLGIFKIGDPVFFWLNIATGLGGLTYMALVFFILIPLRTRAPYLAWVFVVLNGIGVGWISIVERIGITGMATLLYAVLISLTVLLYNRWPTYVFVAVSLASVYALPGIIGAHPGTYSTETVILVLILSVGACETIVGLKKAVYRQFRRLEIINHMTRSLAFSIEPNQVVALMSGAIQAGLEADTYYIGFIRDHILDLQLLYDDGDFYYGISYDLDESLAGWIVRNKKSLLLSNVPVQSKAIGYNLATVGKPKISLSWMGTMLQTGEGLIGVVAVASYRKNAFNDSDLELLESFAQQSAVTLDNAYHHAEVERQSRLDSLTGALNHRNFIEALELEAEKSAAGGFPLSLIMLDVDFFKHFNDGYGHLTGDRVLVAMVEAIKSHIKSTDLVGRWGGEEFAIALPNSNKEQAVQVADRIRSTLRSVSIFAPDGTPTPSPTVSQGVAVFPTEAENTFALIDLADRRLYVAKERGRDQVEAAVFQETY